MIIRLKLFSKEKKEKKDSHLRKAANWGLLGGGGLIMGNSIAGNNLYNSERVYFL